RYTRSMRLLVSVMLLMVQFGPLAGAGMCMRAAAQPKAECAMPMQGTTHDNERPHSSSSQDCAQMVICAPSAPVIPEVAVRFFGISQPGHTSYSTPASLFSGDPIVPPQPPPIV
ncbi:MAG: hypothetical protein ABI766_07445, partial [Gemmatimonadales bacterium]